MYLYLVGTNSPFSDDFYEFSDFVKDLFLDKNLSDDASKEMKRRKLGEVKEIMIFAEGADRKRQCWGQEVGCC